MSFYTANAKDENEPRTLPNIEVFHVSASEFILARKPSTWMEEMTTAAMREAGPTRFFERDLAAYFDVEDGEVERDADLDGTTAGALHDAVEAERVIFANEAEGWYYWCCLPGCLPDSDASGPYATEEAALDAARETFGDGNDEDDDLCVGGAEHTLAPTVGYAYAGSESGSIVVDVTCSVCGRSGSMSITPNDVNW